MFRRQLVVWASLAALVGCKETEVGTPDPTPSVTDTGWFGGTDPAGCTATVVETEPVQDDARWFWRDAPRVFVTESDPSGFTASIYGPDGQEVPTEIVWGVGLDFTVEFDGGLAPDADHLLEITDCSGSTRIDFRTDVYGLPLESGAASLTGNTYQLDLVGADWLQPSGLGPLLVGFFTTPILLGVGFSDDTNIDLLGAPGFTNIDGVLAQSESSPTWDFPLVSFADAPYVQASSDNVVFEFDDVAIPIDDFTFETTFSPDGTTLGGTVIGGVADTRYLGELISDPEPGAICAVAASIGTECIACADGGPYCLVMEVHNVDGTFVPGLTLHTID